MFFWTWSRARNSEETAKKEDYRPRCTCFLGRKLTNVYSRLPSTPPNLRVSPSLLFLLASSIDIVVRPPLHLFPLFVSDLNLRPGYQLAVPLFALHRHQDLISVTVVTIGAVVIIFVFQPRPLVVFNMEYPVYVCYVCIYRDLNSFQFRVPRSRKDFLHFLASRYKEFFKSSSNSSTQ